MAYDIDREHQAAARAMRLLAHATEQLQKRNYLNALSAINDAEKSTLEAFRCILDAARLKEGE